MLCDVLEGVLPHVPRMDLPFDGDCARANGLDLPVVVINLPHRTDRWQTLSRRMSAAGLTKVIRAPAVGGGLPDNQIAALLRSPVNGIDAAPRSHLTLTRPAIGCFLSHLAIWRWVLDMNLPRILVFEDDAAPAAHYCPVRFRSVVGSITEDTGLVFLGRMIMGGLADRPNGSDLARIYYFNGTFAYLITPAACRSCSNTSCRRTRILITRSARCSLSSGVRSRPITPSLISSNPIGRCAATATCRWQMIPPPIANSDTIDESRRVLLDEGRPLLSLTA
ncbi:MAG: glycosyltransferase family 25 protein [Hyphomicrobiaceae bacterium]|jgi:hypothetical protein